MLNRGESAAKELAVVTATTQDAAAIPMRAANIFLFILSPPSLGSNSDNQQWPFMTNSLFTAI